MSNYVEVRGVKIGEGVPKICVPIVGKTKEEILKIFANKYGQQIRYAPEMNGSTIALWVLPAGFLVLFIGCGAYLFWRRRKS